MFRPAIEMWKVRPCSVCFFSSLNFHHLIFVTHHSSLITLNTTPIWHRPSIFFTLFVGSIPVTHCRFFFFFYPNSSNLVKKEKKRERERERERNPEQIEVKKKKTRTDRSERKKKKKKKREETQNRPKWKKEEEEKKRKEKKKNRTAKKKEKKSQKWSKVAASTVCGSTFICLITILLLSYELWKLKTAKMCFQFP